MHPLHEGLNAQLIIEERLRKAALAARARDLVGPPATLRERVGAGLVRVGTRLQHPRGVAPAAAGTC